MARRSLQGGLYPDPAAQAVKDGHADAVAFGRHNVANLDLR